MTKRHIIILAVYLLLLVLAIPWYWSSGELVLVYGVPVWVITAICVGLLVAILTAWNLLSEADKDVEDDGE